MSMMVSTKGRYALRVMIELAARCDILLIQTMAEGHRPVA